VLAALAASSNLCPPGAAALGVGGLGSICQVAGGVAGGAAGVAGSAASQVAGFGVDSVLDALGSWVAAGAVWLLDQVGAVLTSTTSIDLGASWFTEHYETMAALCGVVVLPMLFLGVIQAIYRQDLSMLLRSVLVNVPLALLLTAVAAKLVQLGLAVTDELSAAVAQGAGLDAGHFMTGVTTALSNGTPGQPAVPAFIVFLGAIAVVVGTFLVWIELLVRAAAVYVAVLFLPLALASLAWPAIAHWCRRLVDTLVALVLGKFVIVSVLSLAAGALGAGTDGSGGGSFTAVLGGAALLLLASLAPWALLRLLPFLEAGAVAHLEGLSQRARHMANGPSRRLANTALRLAATSAVGGTAGLLLGSGSGSGGGGGGFSGFGGSGSTSRGGGQGRPSRPGAAARLGTGDASDPDDDRSASDTGGGGAGPLSGPGTGIPLWEPNAELSEVARRLQPEGPVMAESSLRPSGDRSALTPSPTTQPIPAVATARYPATAMADGRPVRAAGVTSPPVPRPTPLPRQTGVRLADTLERDEIGARLVSRALPPGSADDG
jgi:hypothetical protein